MAPGNICGGRTSSTLVKYRLLNKTVTGDRNGSSRDDARSAPEVRTDRAATYRGVKPLLQNGYSFT